MNLLSVFSPVRCLGCGRILPLDSEPLCETCASLLWKTDDLCYGEFEATALRAAFSYSGVAAYLLRKIKVSPHKEISAFFGRKMADVAQSYDDMKHVDAVVYIPRAGDGYNQARSLAVPLARALHVPVYDNVLGKREGVRSQTKCPDRAHRASNAAKAYYLLPNADLTGKTVLLCDDIFTTGSTVRVCTALLRQAGAKDVVAITAAHRVTDSDRNVPCDIIANLDCRPRIIPVSDAMMAKARRRHRVRAFFVKQTVDFRHFIEPKK